MKVNVQVKQLREKLKLAVRGAPEVAAPPHAVATASAAPNVKESDVFLSQLNALSTPRNIRTRRLAQAQDNPEMTKTARLAHIFRHLYNAIAQAKGITSCNIFIKEQVNCLQWICFKLVAIENLYFLYSLLLMSNFVQNQ